MAMACPPAADAQVSVTTQQNDIGRTGQNLNETKLTAANVNAATFGKLFSQPVDGAVYAQPLYLSNLNIGGGTHNVVFIATQHDSVYAFDADSNSGANANPLWMASMLTAAHGAAAGATTVPWPVGSDAYPEVGITGTPVIDPASNTLYVVSKSLEGGSKIQRLHALDVTTGAEKFGGPVVIAASVPGSAIDNVGGIVSFNAAQENQRPGLLLLNGIVYIGWTAHEDISPWHGWIMGYSAATLRQTGAFCASPNGNAAGVWMSGTGLAADQLDPVNHPYGRMFVATGNGDYTATKPYSNHMDYGDSHLALDLTNGVPTVTDEFTTKMQATDNATDGDVGSGGILVLPTQTAGSFPHLLVQSDKSGAVYVLNRDNLGGYNTSTDQAVQELSAAVGNVGTWSSPAYWNGTVYYWAQNDHLKAFPLVAGLLSTPSQSAELYGFPGATPAISANGTADAIVWSIKSAAYGVAAAELQAHSATNVATMLYSTLQNYTRDRPGVAVKFTIPTVANGKVYVGTSQEVDFYGLLSGTPVAATPTFTPNGGTYTSAQTVTMADATAGAKIYYTTNGTTPTTASTSYSGPVTVSASETLEAIATATGYSTSAVGAAAYTINSGTAPAAVPTFSPNGGAYASAQTVTMADATAGAKIYYTTNGTTPTTASTLYSGPITVSATELIEAIATATGYSTSAVGSVAYTITNGTAPVINDPTGFASTAGLNLVGGATLTGSTLQLTTANGGVQAKAVWFTTPVNVQKFTTDFTFQITSPVGNGLTFALQNAPAGVNAVGMAGGGLGYQNIRPSVAVKFDLINNAGEGNNSTGFYTNGTAPTVPAVDLTPSGVNLHSGDTMHAHITYDGTTLTLTLTDVVTNATFTTATTINIPAAVGANTAYAGFTAGTGASTANESILNWTYLTGVTAAAAVPTFSPNGGAYTSAQTVTMADATAGAKIYYTTNGTTPTTASTLYSGPITVGATELIEAIATAAGFSTSAVGSVAYTINSGTAPAAVPTFSPNGGAYTSAQTVTMADATAGANIYYTTNGTTPTTASTLYSGPITVSATELIEAIATATGYSTSAVGSVAYTITNGTAPVINDPTGFSSSTGLSLVGGATVTGNALQLSTATGGVQSKAVWYSTPVNVQKFTTDFDFQIISPAGDGFTFALQNAAAGVNAIGMAGGGLGYQNIGSSVAVKFDLYSNSGEGINSTGFYTNGAAPTVPAVDLTPSGVNLQSGDTMHAHITYDGTTLTLTLTDKVTNASFTTSTAVNIPATVGTNTAYVGFTAGTGGSTATQSILNWTYVVN